MGACCYPAQNPCNLEILDYPHITDGDAAVDWFDVLWNISMDREVDIQLIQYRALSLWVPRVGDVIIKHGWFIRTKWFGVVNFINSDGSLNIIKDGLMSLLVATAPEVMRGKSIELGQGQIKTSTAGAYTIMQHDADVVWYV